MTTLDFRNCKTAEDVKKVFDKAKSELEAVKEALSEVDLK
jgi:hypothetical protein